MLNSFSLIPPQVVSPLNHISRGCLVVAIAAIGVRTSLRDVRKLGLKPIGLIVGETLVLALIGLATAVFLLPHGIGL